MSQIEAELLAQRCVRGDRYYFGDVQHQITEPIVSDDWGWVFAVSPQKEDAEYRVVVSRSFGFALLVEEFFDEEDSDWPTLIETRRFVLNYSRDRDFESIECAWSGEQSESFVDPNIDFRGQVTEAVCQDYRGVSLELVEDLMSETSKCSQAAWGFFRFYDQLCGHLLRLGGCQAMPHLLHWRASCFDTFITSELPYLLIEEIDQLRHELPDYFQGQTISYMDTELDLEKALEYLETVEDMQDSDDCAPQFRRQAPEH